MRRFALILFASTLAGCSLWMPKPDPAQAWIELAPHQKTDLQALAVDGRHLDDDRYFQVQPGSRTLEMRYRFQVEGADIGPNSEPLPRDCKLSLAYDRFTAGTRYRLVAGGYGFRPWAKLYDQHQSLLARASEQGCGNLAER
ncbi:PA0061/PA0062 family lipoprotein [Stutzerimonas stutzeri]